MVRSPAAKMSPLASSLPPPETRTPNLSLPRSKPALPRSVMRSTFARAVSAAEPTVQHVRLSDLPLTKILFLPDGTLVGAGHSYDPLVFGRGASGWSQLGQLSASKTAKEAGSAVAENRRMFQAQATMGAGGAVAKLESAHQSQVCGLQYFGSTYGSTEAVFTTSALDGKVVFWTRDQLSNVAVKAMEGLAIS